MIIKLNGGQPYNHTDDTFEVTNIQKLEVARSATSVVTTLTDGRRCELRVAARLCYNTGRCDPLLILNLRVNNKRAKYCKFITPGEFVTLCAQHFALRPADVEYLRLRINELSALVVANVPTVIGL